MECNEKPRVNCLSMNAEQTVIIGCSKSQQSDKGPDESTVFQEPKRVKNMEHLFEDSILDPS